MGNFPASKAAGLDRIPNETIKAALEVIIIPLANAVTTYLFEGKLPECCKETNYGRSTKGEDKKDYSLPGSYRPVAIENTLGKLLEKIVVERM